MSKEVEEANLIRALLESVRRAQDYERRTGRKLGGVKGEVTPREELFLELATASIRNIAITQDRVSRQFMDGSVSTFPNGPLELSLELIGVPARALDLLRELMDEGGFEGTMAVRS